jgi:hypothetical protein
LPEPAAVTPDAAAAFVVVDAGCFQMRRSTSTARWYHGDLWWPPPDLAPAPSFLHGRTSKAKHRSRQPTRKMLPGRRSLDRACMDRGMYLGCRVFFAIFCIKREWRNIWTGA